MKNEWDIPDPEPSWLEGFARSAEGPGSGSGVPHVPSPLHSVRQDILNHVFDDVESFVSKLQKSAEAARVLEHRERGRRTRRREAGGEARPGVGSPSPPLVPWALPDSLPVPRVSPSHTLALHPNPPGAPPL